MDKPLDLNKKRPGPWDEMELVDKDYDKLKLVDQDGELLLECKIGDKYHQLLLEIGLNTILDQVLKWDKEWTSLDEEE
jgi:hypothetical protein